jgi:choline dehydrogenase-like flavoprotein
MQWDRGSDADYDAWEELRNDGWGFSGLEKYFKRSTHFIAPSEALREEFDITYDALAYGSSETSVAQVTIPSQLQNMKNIFRLLEGGENAYAN